LFNERDVVWRAWFYSLLMVVVFGIVNSRRAAGGGRSEAFLHGAAVGLLTLNALDLMVEVVGALCFLAEREGFEPSEGLLLHRFSKPAL
jgi:hypothetical protein